VKVSIVTVVYNNVDTVAASIQSVLSQDYSNIEYIVIDGQSTDGTLDVIQEYASQIDVLVSEKDNGLYDALNKGMSLATGDVIGIIHSDDIFNSEQSVSQIAATFQQKEVDCVYGNLVYVDRNDTEKVIRNWQSGAFQRKKLLRGWMPPHPTFYVKQSSINQHGLYDTSFTCSADYELMLRYLSNDKLKVDYVNQTLVRMRVGGVSNRNWKNRWQANREDSLAWKKNGLSPSPFLRWMKPLRKVGQFRWKGISYQMTTYLSLLIPFLIFIAFSGNSDYLEHHPYLKTAASTFFSWGIVAITIPVVLKLAACKQLMDNPNGRSSHQTPTPTLGGIGIFTALMLGIVLWIKIDGTNYFQYLLAAFIIIFFIGLKDDLLVISPIKKLAAQIVASSIIIIGADLQLESFYGVLGVEMLPAWFGFLFSLFVCILIINAYNLIDGVDGLASVLGGIAACFFGGWFFATGYFNYAILAFVAVGALVAFIRFNFSRKQKIFLGDTGSMLIGLLSAIMALQFIKLNSQASENYFHNAPLLVITVLGVALFDVLRVVIVRLRRNQFPLSPDRSHIHHLLLDLNFSHKKATLFLGMGNIAMILIAMFTLPLLQPTAAFLLILLFFFCYLILCHQLQFSNPKTIKLFFLRYIRLDNGKRALKTSRLL